MTSGSPNPSDGPDDPYSAAARVQRLVDNDVRRQLQEYWDVQLIAAQPLIGGDASSVWKIETRTETLVVRISPQHVAVVDLERILQVQAVVSSRIAIVPGPIRSKSGSFVHVSNENPISVQTFRPGAIRRNMTSFDQTLVAETQADLHLALDQCLPPASALPSHMEIESNLAIPDELRDDELDAWVLSLPSSGWKRSLIHGDYYGRNILWEGDRISGVVDWDELALDWREQELTWSIWEFCHIADRTRLDVPAAHEFLKAYLSSNPNIAPAFSDHAYRFIQRRLRAECMLALRERALGRPFDEDYFLSGVAAFRHVRGVIIDDQDAPSHR